MKNIHYSLTIALSLFIFISCSTENTPVYTLTTTTSPSDGGEITPNAGTFEEGDAVSLKAIPNEGWVFSRWEQDVNTTANPMNIIMNSDYIVVGIFEQRMHNLTLNVEGQGTVKETVVRTKSTDYAEGTVVELEAIPAEGWEFSHWEGHLTDSDNPTEIIVDEPKSIVAVFSSFTEIVDVTNPATGRTWMDRNLGAIRVAASSWDTLAYGDLYQWGRLSDGHEKRNSGITSTLSSLDQPGHGDYIISGSGANGDWRNPQNHNLWQSVNGANNPCPTGYRIPTEDEWIAERQSWDRFNIGGAFDSPLKLPAAGGRDGSGISQGGELGLYWSSSVSDTRSMYLGFDHSYVMELGGRRSLGFSIRCIKD